VSTGEPNVASLAIAENLAAGIKALGLILDAPRLRLLLEYLRLLTKWNQTYNLTAIHDPWAMVTQHLLDCLAMLPYVPEKQNARLLDVGSGAGLPGMVLAIARSDLHCALLDSNGKKTRFLTQAKIELKLPNVEVVQARAEEYRAAQPFDCIVSRAVGTLVELVAQTRHLLASGGQWLAMKGARPEAELAALPSGFHATVHRLQIPGLKAERHLVVIEMTG
jgi:16S rRNA (guanine527-N7)-methyltransferase